MLAPMLVQMERQIDREIAADQKKLNNGFQDQTGLDDDDDSDVEEETMLIYGPVPQIVTNDLKSLDEMVSLINNRRLAATITTIDSCIAHSS